MARRPQRARGRAARWGAPLRPFSSRLNPRPRPGARLRPRRRVLSLAAGAPRAPRAVPRVPAPGEPRPGLRERCAPRGRPTPAALAWKPWRRLTRGSPPSGAGGGGDPAADTRARAPPAPRPAHNCPLAIER